MRKRLFRFIVLFLVSAIVSLGMGRLSSYASEPQRSEPIEIAQIESPGVAVPLFSTGNVWQNVYRLVPNVPMENTYVDRDSGDIDEDNTLIGRIIRYHLYVKNRLPFYRLDWKLTLSDYLGAHDWIVPETYPSAQSLRENPRDGDIAVIESLSRDERNALVDALVVTFNPEYLTRLESANEEPASNDSEMLGPTEILEPQPGAAELLMP